MGVAGNQGVEVLLGMAKEGALKPQQSGIDGIDLLAQPQPQIRSNLIVAAPAFLGTLRNQLSDQTRKLVSIEMDKNLTQQKADVIRGHLPEYLPNTT